jgi:hypothetical protein
VSLANAGQVDLLCDQTTQTVPVIKKAGIYVD